MLKRLLGSLAVFSLALSSCATVDTPPRGAVPGPALWRLADEDTTIYLFGTVHVLPRDKVWFDERIERAFAESDELVTEIDIASIAGSGQALQAAGMLPEDQSLRDLMSEENRQAYEEALVAMGLPVEALDRLEPWFAAMTLSLLPVIRAGYDPQSGVEMALGAQAGEKRRDALETIEDQIELFAAMPREAQLAFLDQTVEAVPHAANSLDAMVAEWIEGDAAGLAALMNAELTDPMLHERLLIQRNANWAEWIERRMEEPGTVFIAVGAGHLAGEDSVQDLLRKRGIRAQRVWR